MICCTPRSHIFHELPSWMWAWKWGLTGYWQISKGFNKYWQMGKTKITDKKVLTTNKWATIYWLLTNQQNNYWLLTNQGKNTDRWQLGQKQDWLTWLLTIRAKEITDYWLSEQKKLRTTDCQSKEITDYWQSGQKKLFTTDNQGTPFSLLNMISTCSWFKSIFGS